MNYIDLLLIIVMLLTIWSGYQRGFIVSSLLLLIWIGSLFFSFICYPYLSTFLNKVFPSLGIWSSPFSFILLVIVSRFCLDILSNKVIDEVPDRIHQSLINKILGFVPGAVNGLIWVAFLGALLMLVPFSNEISIKARESKLAGEFGPKVSLLEDKLYPVFKDVFTRSALAKEEGDEKSVKLPYTIKNTKPRADLEAEMLVLINKERTSRGINPLTADAEMAQVACKHSEDMFARGYFSHYTPEGLDPFDRMRRDNLRFLAAGENLAHAPTLSIAHTGLMHSPGHRANILNRSYGRVGISIIDGGVYGLMITQDFRN